MNQTLVIFKPDCVRRGLVGECLARFERRGFAIGAIQRPGSPEWVATRLMEHYDEHLDRPYYDGLIRMMTSGPLVTCILTGPDVVRQARNLAGPYKDPIPGTIRGDYATGPMFNVIHTSADEAAAVRELSIWFSDIV
jgi:nucleoside-diphosphate kinase